MHMLQKYWVPMWNSLLEKVASTTVVFIILESQNLTCTSVFPLSHKTCSLKLFLKPQDILFCTKHALHSSKWSLSSTQQRTRIQPAGLTTFCEQLLVCPRRGKPMLLSDVSLFPLTGNSGSPQMLAVSYGYPFLIAAPIFLVFFIFFSVLSLGKKWISLISTDFRDSIVAFSKGLELWLTERSIDKP